MVLDDKQIVLGMTFSGVELKQDMPGQEPTRTCVIISRYRKGG